MGFNVSSWKSSLGQQGNLLGNFLFRLIFIQSQGLTIMCFWNLGKCPAHMGFSFKDQSALYQYVCKVGIMG